MFITCEGGEGAGKTTLIKRLEKELINQGYEVVITREPGGSKLGGYIRQWLLNRDTEIVIGGKAELLLFLAARAQHIEELIRPALLAGKVVICDRFNDSTIAYQGYARALGADYVESMCRLVCGDIQPNLTLFLDVDPQEGLRRTMRTAKENALAGQVDRIEAEKLEFHQRVREGFMQIAQREPDRFRIIDANKPLDTVFAKASHYLAEFL